MATYTSALNLKKPAGGENVLIGDINGNMDAIDAEAIRSRANFAGTYDASSSYSVGNYCIYGGNLFRCITAIGSGGETWTAGHWTQVAVGEELSTLNGKIAKYAIASKQSDTVNGNSSGTVVFDMPSGATTIKAIIPYGYNPSGSWDTMAVIQANVDISTRTVYFRTIGSTAQKYSILAIIVYI